MPLKPEDVLQDPRVGSVESRVRKVDWIWEQIKNKQREIRLLENELSRTDSNEYLENDSRLD
jgi:hypothetical protein